MLPPGIDWYAVDPQLARLLDGLGVTLVRGDATVSAMERDAVPTRSDGDQLARWEEACALPDYDRPDPGSSTSARQAAVGAALAQGGTSTPDALAALADVWSLVAEAVEYADFPAELWIYGPSTEVKAFRVGTSTVSDPLLYVSETWQHVVNLIVRRLPAHVRLHTADALPI